MSANLGGIGCRPAHVYAYIAADAPAQQRQLLIERREAGLKDRIIRCRRQQHADDAHALARLRVRNKRNCRDVAQQNDEITSSHCRHRG